jgi:hypothetical protein
MLSHRQADWDGLSERLREEKARLRQYSDTNASGSGRSVPEQRMARQIRVQGLSAQIAIMKEMLSVGHPCANTFEITALEHEIKDIEDDEWRDLGPLRPRS